MSRPTKYLEIKNCNRFKLNKNLNDFRMVKPLMSSLNKGKKIGWTDLKRKHNSC
tara:strand:- start:254 stop:415 length:162 start_codon:yes stop_codon:yes gene_type:complete